MRVVITGGSSGIGRAIVESFCSSSDNHAVLFTYFTNGAGAQALVDRFPRAATAVYCDQGDLDSIAMLYETVRDWLQGEPLDVLVNNAALGSETVASYSNMSSSVSGDARATDDAVMAVVRARARHDEALMRVNALGPLWISDCLVPLMSGARGLCIMIGSVGGSSSAVFPEYSAADLMSKAALGYLSKHMAAAHIYSNIDVICVSPGATDTDMFRTSTLNKLKDPDKFIAGMPKGRLIMPAHIADFVLWLARHQHSRMFHGAVLDASMGLAVRPGVQTELGRT